MMFLHKYRHPILIGFGIILILCGYLIFSKKTSKIQSSVSENAAPSESKPLAEKTKSLPTPQITTPGLDELKTQKALENVKHQNRKPSTQINSIPKSLTPIVLLQNTSWRLWPSTKVIRRSNKSDSDVVLAEVSNLSIVADENKTLAKDLTEFNVADPVVVYDARLKKAGVITGIIKIETEQRGQLESDLQTLNAHITEAFDPIQTYFLTSQENIFDLESLFENLKQKPYIKNIELEILNKTYEKN